MKGSGSAWEALRREEGEQIEPVLYQTSPWLCSGFKDEVFPPTGRHWHGMKPDGGTVVKVDVRRRLNFNQPQMRGSILKHSGDEYCFHLILVPVEVQAFL